MNGNLEAIEQIMKLLCLQPDSLQFICTRRTVCKILNTFPSLLDHVFKYLFKTFLKRYWPGQNGLIAVDELVDFLPDFLLQSKLFRNALLDVESILENTSEIKTLNFKFIDSIEKLGNASFHEITGTVKFVSRNNLNLQMFVIALNK